MTIEIDAQSARQLAADMKQFIHDQAKGRKPDVAERYAEVAGCLSNFLSTVDVVPWLGPEIGAYLKHQRQSHGDDALLTSLGLSSLIRVLPAFLADPWLPATGVQRRTHRTVVRHLRTFLRLRALQEGCFRRDDFSLIDRALRGSAYDYPQAPVRRDEFVTCTATMNLRTRLVDAVLHQVSHGEYDTFDEAIAARLNPVERMYWETPDQDIPYGW